ncbi:hypothetical protein [Micromonospora rosaria]|uniref:hypothetical protein n=1 Tax=Micromonospora rosaria TaxID=47874 RepID=UPI000ABD79A6|nr:hypothetical protein [Micromonospora rosaria]
MIRQPADHPHTDPGDGRTECDLCGKWVWEAIHSCKGVPATEAAKARYEQWRRESPYQPGGQVTATLDDTTGTTVTTPVTIDAAHRLTCGCTRLLCTRPGPEPRPRDVILLTGCAVHERQVPR